MTLEGERRLMGATEFLLTGFYTNLLCYTGYLYL